MTRQSDWWGELGQLLLRLTRIALDLVLGIRSYGDSR